MCNERRCLEVNMCGKFGMLIAVIGLLSFNSWSQEYTVTNLGTLGGNESVAYSVNDAGQVAGYSTLQDEKGPEPFLYSNGNMIGLGSLGEGVGWAYAVNNNGHVAGTSWDADGPQAFLWNGALQKLVTGNPGYMSAGLAINASDVVLGWCCTESDPFPPAAVFSGGTFTYVPIGSYAALSPAAINNSGQIVGACWKLDGFTYKTPGCVITGTTVQTLHPLAGHSLTQASAINNAGHICGASGNPNNQRVATIWFGTSPFTLGQPNDGHASECLGLNDADQGVGDANGQSHPIAVLYDLLNGAQDINQLIVPIPQVVVENAYQISNTGYIAARCIYSGSHTRACLLKPNSVLIVKKDIFALEQNDPGCIACKAVLDPEANSLPDTLTDLTPEQQKQVTATIETMIVQLRLLEHAGQISATQAKLLVHQSQLVIAALRTT
jgi:probable HAF family extracellular repeat protein